MPRRRREGFCGGKGKLWIEGFILLKLSERPSHGYDLAKFLGEIGLQSEGVGAMGGLYRILGEMESLGFLQSKWNVEDSGPAKKEYEITELGKEALYNYKGNFNNVKKLLELFEQEFKNFEIKNRKEE